MEEYIRELIEGGYIDENGRPLKCQFCEHEELDTINHYGEFSFIIEIAVYCQSCQEKVGEWNYGSW